MISRSVHPLAPVHAAPGHAGFSLIEVLVVTALVALLAALAYPSYAEHVARARRAEARATLMEAAQYMERYYSARGSYEAATLPQRLQASPPGAASPSYTLTVTVDPGGGGYTLSAQPLSNARDPCGELSLTHTGVRARAGEGLSNEACWR
jgi:type IV pilus assembly protein PilE